MIIKIKKENSSDGVHAFFQQLIDKNLSYSFSSGTHFDYLTILNHDFQIKKESLVNYPFIDEIFFPATPYLLASRFSQEEDTVIEVNGIRIGAQEKIVMIAGPCAVESKEQTEEIAKEVKRIGANWFRGGAFKPRTSPYSFQGLKKNGLDILAHCKETFGMPIVSEIVSIESIKEFSESVDIIQVGARNMQNFELLKALGKLDKPIILKRGLANTVDEWLMSAEYILAGGNKKVILCERGIRTFETSTRFTLDVSIIPVIKKLTHLPIIIDPSHATGSWDLVEPLSRAAIAAGADGLMIEVHNHPSIALSDGMQSLKCDNFEKLMTSCRKVAQAIGRDFYES